MNKKLFVVICCIISATLFAQQGKNGTLTLATSVKVNEYTYLTANATASNTIITVASSLLNTHSRFSGTLAPGDLIMIIQMQGVSLNASIDPYNTNVGQPKDSSWGAILNYNNCGNYELAEVNAVPSGTTIRLDCPLQYSYTAAGKVQIVRIPRYSSLTVNSGGIITCDPWDSAIGGIIAMEVQGNTVINGSINADSAGFRGGRFINNQDSTGWGIGDVASRLQSFGKEKGEGIGGYEWSYAQYGGKECMGAPGNAGGGGTAQNAGGGGGANGGVVANYINGFGNPDITTSPTNYTTAWNLEFTWMSKFTSSGGGRGGYSFSANNVSPLTYGPNNSAAWAGDQRRNVGGRGGRPLDYSTGKIFMAGGGGAGDQNEIPGEGGIGGKGGGIVYLMNYGTVSGTGQIISNGENGFNSHGGGIDAAGGAGAGGTILVNSVGAISGISLTANGGTGGNQVITVNVIEAEGPGGGGGGGYIATSNTGLTEAATGGANGTTNAVPMTKFLPNGATKGGAGTTGATITNFHLTAKNDTICDGSSATLTASIIGTLPGGTTLEWYTKDTGSTPVGSGSTFTTPALTTTTTYYVGSCPGTYRIPVTVVVKGSGTVGISSDTSICKGSSATLKATGGTAYSWLPTMGLNNAAIATPVATPTATTTYTVSITTSCGVIKDSVKITVLSLASATISANTSQICAGKSVTITAGGGTSYLWSNNATTSSISVTLTTTTTYTVKVINGGCTKDTNIVITVNPLPTVTIHASNNPISCGTSTTITATGGTNYTWSNGNTASSITVTPTSNTSYTVGVSNGGCTKDTSIAIKVTPLQVIIHASNNPISCGTLTTITATGGTNYTWSNGNTASSITVSPTSTITYTVGISNNGGCTKDTSIIIKVTPLQVTIHASNNPIVCVGSPTTITATGGTNYIWSNGSTASSITVSPAATTTYTVGVSDGSCQKDTDITITVNPSYTTTATASNNPVCSGTPTTITATNGTNYTWSNGSTTSSITVNPLSTVTYFVIVSNGSCTTSDSVTIKVNPLPTVSISPSNNPVCSGTPTTITATGGTIYTWSNNATTSSLVVAPLLTTIYTVSISNGVCTKDTSIQLTVKPSPDVTITPDTAICTGNTITLTVTGGGTYLWSNSSTLSSIIVSPATTTTYTAQVTLGGCTKDTAVNILVSAIPVPLVNGPFTICKGEPVSLNASGGNSYLWEPSTSVSDSVIANPVATPGSSTVYTVTVYSNAGCYARDTIAVAIIPGASGVACCSTTIPHGGSEDLSVSGAQTNSTYKWNPAEGLSCSACPDPIANPTVTTKYTVTITDSNGCELIDSVLITVEAEGCGDIFVPTAFSPNEKINNILYVRGGCIATMEFEVFDRWGNRVFSSTNADVGWDGNSNGHAMNMDTYIYYLKVILNDGSVVYKKGNVTLVR